MAYQVKYTETTNPAKPALKVDDQRLNTETDLTFVGKNYPGYAPLIAENFLHLLENFASNTEPANPVQGQLWYDNTSGVNLLKVYDGTTWSAAGSVKKDPTAPSVSNSIKGDLWVNTSTQQLYVYSGSNWLLVGPQFSSGLKTGPLVETFADIYDTVHNVVTFYSDNFRIAIVSKAAFTPKISIAGFANINQGLNISTVDALSSTSPTKFWGTAEKADALVVGDKTVLASNFLRSDIPSTTNYTLNVRNNDGISIGADLSFNISSTTSPNTTLLQSNTSGGSIDINVTTISNVTISAIHVDSSGKIGLGPNNTAPSEILDVAGNAVIRGIVSVTDTTDSSSTSVGSVKTAGGLAVAKKASIGGDLSTFSKIVVNNLDGDGNPIQYASVLVPGVGASNMYNIGEPNRKFNTIYASTFVGSFSGSFSGNVTGNVTGYADGLTNDTTFSLTGDVTSDGIVFNGQTADGTVTLTTSINQGIITAKPQITTSLPGDQLLVYRSGTDSGLKRITKQNFIANIPTVPVGAIMPFAGSTVPAGYLLCDGSEISISTYSVLFTIIGYTYKRTGLVGKNTFGLPDLRGRFPLGRDNMDNGLYVQSITNELVSVKAGGGSANRVTSPIADTLGDGSGADEKTLEIRNLPDHMHDLYSGNDQYFAVGLPNAAVDSNASAGKGLPSTGTGYGLPNSGGVVSARTGDAFNAMNPYQTINYIIFTGVI